MDVDNEIDAGFLQQFNCLGTTDKDILIIQLQKLLNNQINVADSAFLLDMNNWNLQAAVCSYFDFECVNDNLPLMIFIKDVTIGEGEAVPPNTKFVKTWRIQNSGRETWPPGCSLKFHSGDRLGHEDKVLVEPLGPREAADVSVQMVSPEKAGIYQGQWRMCTATGQLFGEVIWVILTVAEGGLLGVTQQMNAFNQLGSSPQSNGMAVNPFATSPNGKVNGVEEKCLSQNVPSTDLTTLCNGEPSPPPTLCLSTSPHRCDIGKS